MRKWKLVSCDLRSGDWGGRGDGVWKRFREFACRCVRNRIFIALAHKLTCTINIINSTAQGPRINCVEASARMCGHSVEVLQKQFIRKSDELNLATTNLKRAEASLVELKSVLKRRRDENKSLSDNILEATALSARR